MYTHIYISVLKQEWIQQVRREKEVRRAYISLRCGQEHLQQICYCGFRAKEAIQSASERSSAAF